MTAPDITARIAESRRLLETLAQARRQIDTCGGTKGNPCSVCDAARDRIRMAKTKLVAQHAALLDVVEALDDAMQVAFDGPRVAVGTGCAEGYSEWKARIKAKCRAALAAYARAGGAQ